MKKNRTKALRKSIGGVTILEVLVCIVVLLVAILGTSTYQFSASMHARKANLQATASRIALMMGEAWDGLFAAPNFNPVVEFQDQLTIAADDGPDMPAGWTQLNNTSYKITIENNDYYATLSYMNIDGQAMRALSIIVSWDQSGHEGEGFDTTDKSYSLTIYVENPIKI